MKHVRITNGMRDRMVAHMLGKATGVIMDALKLEENDLALEVLDHYLGKHKKAFYSLPDSFMRSTRSFYVLVQGEADADTLRECLKFHESIKGEVKAKNRRVPSSHNGYGNPTILLNGADGSEKTKELSRKVKEFFARYQEVQTKKTKLEGQLKVTVHQFTSTKKMETEWPEGFEAWKQLFYDDKAEAPLPTIPVREVNAMLADFPDAVAAE